MRTAIFKYIGLISICGLCYFPAPEAWSLADQVREFLRNRIEAAGVPPRITVENEIIHSTTVLPQFYERRGFRPAWTDNKRLLPQIKALLKILQEADAEGLRPEDYHLSKILGTMGEVRQNQSRGKAFNLRRLVDLDLLLTDAFLMYGSHLMVGRINPETIDPEWHANRQGMDLAQLLQHALDSGQVEETLRGLTPVHPGYGMLKEALARYQKLASQGGWPKIPDGPKMQRGDLTDRVSVLRARLRASGDLTGKAGGDEALFDENLEIAVTRFQSRNGLDQDGVVGPSTLAALNVSAEERLQQIALNLERWRWLPQDLGNAHILVSMAAFEASVVEELRPVMTMRVIVGKGYRRTPVFSSKINYIVLNPYWHVPPSIAVKDKLPLIRKDPDYLAREHMKVFQGWGANTTEIDPKTIDWLMVGAENFPYRLRQDPGPNNALGLIKFMLPNRFNVYLHDTPSKELFEKTQRTFSSGCIRIEKALDLAEYLLRDDPKWTRASILSAFEKPVEQTILLRIPVPVHLLYWTAWVNEDGSLEFRRDIYGRDKRLAEAFAKRAPIAEKP